MLWLLFLLSTAIAHGMRVRCRELSLFRHQSELLAACEAGNAAKVARLLRKHRNLDPVPCLKAAYKLSHHTVMATVLLDVRCGALDPELLQDISFAALAADQLPLFERALAHRSYSFDVSNGQYMRVLDEHGRALMAAMWHSGQIPFLAALLRIRWREAQGFVYAWADAVHGHPESPFHAMMTAALEDFLFTDPQVRIADILHALQDTEDRELRRDLLAYISGRRQQERAYLALAETFLSVQGDFQRLRGTERMVWDEHLLVPFMAQAVRGLNACPDPAQAMQLLYKMLCTHCPLFAAAEQAVRHVAAGKMKAGHAELFITALSTLHSEPLPQLQAQMQAALGMAMVARLLGVCGLGDLAPAIEAMLTCST